MNTSFLNSNKFYYKIFELSPDALIVTKLEDSIILEVNNAFTQITGYERAEVLGISALEIGLWNTPKDREHLIDRIKTEKKIENLEFSFKSKKGELICTLYSGMIFEVDQNTCLLSIVQNNTEQKKTIENLKKSEDQLKTIVAGSHDGLWNWDLQTNYLYLSPKWKKMIGYEDHELPNELSTFINQLHPDEKESVWGHIKDYLSGKEANYNIEFRYKHKKGHWLSILSRGTAFHREDGTPYCMSGSHTDITEQKKIEAERQEMLKQMLLSSKLASIGRLAAGVGHEINNPLSIIQGAIEVLQRSGPKESSQSCLFEKITSSVDRIKKIVSGLKHQVHRDLETEEVINFHDLMSDCLELIMSIYQNDQVQFEFDWKAENSFVKGNIGEAQQIFFNIVSNAKDSFNGKAGQIKIHTHNQNQFFNVEFKDNGCGIAPEDLDKIYDAFYSTKDVGQGMGLGLNIVHALVSKMNGKISVESQLQKGTCFKLSFPLSTEPS